MSESTVCKVCGKKVEELHTAIVHGVLLKDVCEACVASPKSAEFHRRYDRNWQRRHYAKDIVQPWEKEAYIKSYPEQAKKIYSDDDMRKYG